jgi:hypothetical protein
MTAVANTAFTAAQFNLYVRDNLNETAPAKATAAGRMFVTTGVNAIAERANDGVDIATSETTTSTSYTDLTTPGPSITLTTGVKALVAFAARLANNTGGATSSASVEVSGASTQAGSDFRAIRFESSAANDEARIGIFYVHEGLSSGSNTFKLQYRVSAGTGTFVDRNLSVIAL